MRQPPDPVTLLQSLVRIDTSNPPGNEWEAVETLRRLAKAEGFAVRTFQTAPDRGNVIVSYNGTGRRPLILLSHLDVVGANPAEWSYHPFAATVADGFVWGRGTIDTKQLTVMHLHAMIAAKRRGLSFDRDILLIATSDEESGSTFGLRALLQTPDAKLFDGAQVLTEGGGFPINVGDTPVYLVQTGQKGSAAIRFEVQRRTGGNPFFPDMEGADRAAQTVQRIARFASTLHEDIPATTARFLREISPIYGIADTENSMPRELADALLPHLPTTLSSFVDAMTRSTIVPTIWRGGTKRDSTGALFQIEADARLLPVPRRPNSAPDAHDPDSEVRLLQRLIAEIKQELDVEGQIVRCEPGFESDYDGPAFDAVRRGVLSALADYPDYAEATPLVVPYLSAGGSDGRFLRDRCRVIFGYSPTLPDLPFDQAVRMVHGVDERISIQSLHFGCRAMFETVLRLMEPIETEVSQP